MFEPFCGLSGHPFELRPDPGFFFRSRGHQRAYRRLQYGLRHGGITVLTGEAGAGKTTTIEAFLRQLDDTAVVARKLDCARLDGDELLAAVAQAFGNELAAGGRRRLLILDEAQRLPIESWRDLHRLPLQTFLVGRPELRLRVEHSCHLGPLERDETCRYIEHRLRQVGWKGDAPFDDEALAIIHSHTGGFPRRINLLCARALTGTFVAEKSVLGAEALRRVIQAA